MSRTDTYVRIGMAVLLMLATGAAPDAFAQLGSEGEVEEEIARREMPQRVADMKIDEVIKLLELKPGDIVADIGAGTGVFARPFAKAIGPTGVVYAVEIEQALLDEIDKRAKAAKVANIRPVLGEFNDPKLPSKDVDVVFFHRVLHHIERRAAYLDTVARYLKPAGRIVIIEKPKNDDWMWMKRDHIDGWMAAIGFYPVDDFSSIYKDKFFVVYERPYEGSKLLKKKTPAPTGAAAKPSGR
jgi:SAM-dependent methyltransferase